MRRSAVLALAVAAFVAVTSVLVYSGWDAPSEVASQSAVPADGADPTASGPDGSSDAAPPAGESAEPTSAAVTRPATNVPMRRLAPGEKPPQFVIFSIDGAGSHEIWQQFMETSAAVDARFTAFLTGTYLIDNAHADAYTPPKDGVGTMPRGFGGQPTDIAEEVADLNAAWEAGHEIASFYNDHRCSGEAIAGADWTPAHWTAELDQFMRFVDNWADIGGYGDATPLAFTSKDIVGGRTPCVQNNPAPLGAAWAKHQLRYDASANLYTGIGWPTRLDGGQWEFQIPTVYSPAFEGKLLMTDGSMLGRFGDPGADSSGARKLGSLAKESYEYWFDAVYRGNRAPLTIGTHSNVANADWFVAPTLALMADVCVREDVICASYVDVVDWLDLQTPEVLADLQSRPVVATGS